MSENAVPAEIPRGLFDDIELAILCDWLGRERPAALASIDTEATRPLEVHPNTREPVRLVASYDGYDYGHDIRLANAVARIALNAIADRLPQWMTRSASGQMVFGRESQPRRATTVDPLPRFLMMINWADTAPGVSWPESYHATYLPGFESFVVTLSADSPEAYGYNDVAIGHFSGDADFDVEVERVICEFWARHTSSDPDMAWADLVSGGYIDARTAYVWRERVWGVEEDDEDDEDGEDSDDEIRDV